MFKTNYRLKQVKSIAECSKGEHFAKRVTFKLPFVIKIFVLSIFEWPFYTGFTVYFTQNFLIVLSVPKLHKKSVSMIKIAARVKIGLFLNMKQDSGELSRVSLPLCFFNKSFFIK